MRTIGDILEAKDRSKGAAEHFIIFFDGPENGDFIGGMVTSQINKNVPMKEFHFEKNAENGNQYKFQFKNTNLVIAKLIKFDKWGPFTKIGKLTNLGIKFVESTIGHLHEETWEDYLLRSK